MVDEERSGGRGQPSEEDHGSADVNVLAQQFADMARSLQAQDDPGEVLDEVVEESPLWWWGLRSNGGAA